MHLYSLTLQKAQGIVCAVHGSFAGLKPQQEIAVAKGKVLELIRPDPLTGKVVTLLSTEVFGIIRSMMSFRLTGGSKDYLVIGSDSGRIVILEYQASKNMFEKVHQETFGKTGCRRIVPGQYLAVDPKGRAVMIGAVEKQKLVYILNRDSQARLTISSPLEAHKSNTFVYHVIGVDVGFDNPMFACLEVDYEEADTGSDGSQSTPMTLTFYELDLGLNHVVRKYSEPLDEHANMLIAVPGGSDGPSGVLVCSENYITYKNFGDQPDIRCPIPRRQNDLDEQEHGMIFVCSATHRAKGMFFFLIQTEQGDIFKVTLSVEDDMVTEIRIKYFDTVPVATSLNILKTGFLFVASDFGNHHLYQISHLGENPDEEEWSSAMPLEQGETFFFTPRQLLNLVPVDEVYSLSPIMHLCVADVANEDTPQVIAACGRGARSTLRVLRHGLEVSEMAVSELPGSPTAVWTVKRRIADEFDSYIIVSFSNATLVLSIGETVEEVTDSGFLGTTSTVTCAQIGDDALVQIYPEGIRHIFANKRVNEWRTPPKRQIVKCAVNQRQVVIALTGGEIVYFEMDVTGQLNEYTDRKDMNGNVISMALGSVPAGEQRCRFLAIGLDDNTVRIVSLDPQDCLTPLSMQALPASPESLCLVEMSGAGTGQGIRDQSAHGKLYLNVGLQNGVLLRTVLDHVSGDLSDTRTRYLGTRPVKLFRVRMQGREAVLAISSRCWLLYYQQSRFHLTPLSYTPLEFASGFMSEQCPEGIVAIASNTLRILALEKLGAVFNQQSFDLSYTPRKFVIHSESGNLIIIETDHNAFTDKTKQARRQQIAEEIVAAASEQEQEEVAQRAAKFINEPLPEKQFDSPKAGSGQWASVIRVQDPISGTTLDKIELEQNEAALSIAHVKFNNMPYILIGIARDLVLNPRSVAGGSVHTYQVQDQGTRLQLIHVTPVEEVPYAICGLQGKVLISVGKCLRVYEMGKKKLLKKCENKNFPQTIVNIQTMGSRIYASDISESVFFIRYRRQENMLVMFADDTLPRYTTATCVLDYDTVAHADKFGNVCVLRLPPAADDDIDEDVSGMKSLWDRGWLGGTSQKLDHLANFHVGETILSLQKTTLVPGLSDCLIYATISGSIGVLVPFTSSEDQSFFEQLEMHMRAENPPLCGRDHLSFRSYYIPSKNVIDGDLCEQYNSIDYGKQKSIAEEMDRVPAEVSKKLEDIRTQYAF